jgi:hypothetical protein
MGTTVSEKSIYRRVHANSGLGLQTLPGGVEVNDGM